MMVIISYDVNTQDKKGKSRLRKIANQCQKHAQRVQNSVAVQRGIEKKKRVKLITKR